MNLGLLPDVNLVLTSVISSLFVSFSLSPSLPLTFLLLLIASMSSAMVIQHLSSLRTQSIACRNSEWGIWLYLYRYGHRKKDGKIHELGKLWERFASLMLGVSVSVSVFNLERRFALVIWFHKLTTFQQLSP